MEKPIIGLFGTCGGSKWRDSFIQKCHELEIPFFNPQVDDWNSDQAVEEAEHLANDEIILFPVTDETYGGGSLAETGFSILSALRAIKDRYVVVFIAPDVKPELIEANEGLAKESKRMRRLVKEHLAKNHTQNLFIAGSLEDMFEITFQLHPIMTSIKKVRGKCL